jgi:excisionase family DNA binding protein
MTTHPSLTNWYGVQDIAAELNVSAFVVRSMLQRGELSGVKVGREWRVNVEDLATFLTNRETS